MTNFLVCCLFDTFLLDFVNTWRGQQFKSLGSYGKYWSPYVSETVPNANEFACSMYCQSSPSCQFSVWTGACYLGDCSVTGQTVNDGSHRTVWHKQRKQWFFVGSTSTSDRPSSRIFGLSLSQGQKFLNKAGLRLM